MKQVIYKYDDGVEVLVNIDDNQYQKIIKDFEDSEIEPLSSNSERDFSKIRFPKININFSFKDMLKEKLGKIIEAFKDNFDNLNEKLGTSSAKIEFSLTIAEGNNLIISSLDFETKFTISLSWDYSKK